ncbi:protein of unknown function [Pararobbsia alpina]|uniref:hypothetical protein n=1 Tax=Pararobbsia alpina TaxID=621374 RepID=UPI0039A63BA6
MKNTADIHAAAIAIVHRESGRTLSKADFDLCMRIAKRALNDEALLALKADPRDYAGELWDDAINCDFEGFKQKVAQVIAERDEAQAEIERLTAIIHGPKIVAPFNLARTLYHGEIEFRMTDFSVKRMRLRDVRPEDWVPEDKTC